MNLNIDVENRRIGRKTQTVEPFGELKFPKKTWLRLNICAAAHIHICSVCSLFSQFISKLISSIQSDKKLLQLNVICGGDVSINNIFSRVTELSERVLFFATYKIQFSQFRDIWTTQCNYVCFGLCIWMQKFTEIFYWNRKICFNQTSKHEHEEGCRNVGTQLNWNVKWYFMKTNQEPASVQSMLSRLAHFRERTHKSPNRRIFAQLVVLVFKHFFITLHFIGLTSMLSALLRQQCGDRSLYMGVCSVSMCVFFLLFNIYMYIQLHVNWID